MSLGTAALWVITILLYVHLAAMLALYLVPVHRFEVGRGYRFWPADWAGRLQTLCFVVVEYWAFFLFIVTYPLGWVMPRGVELEPHPDPQDPRNVPVVLVHGYMMNRCCMAPLQLYLMWCGFRRVETMKLRHLRAPVEAFAQQVRRRLAEIDRRHPGLGVHLVGHSMGGLVSTVALQDKASARLIRDVVAVGSPFAGSMLHAVGLGICARQFRPAGVFARRVRAQLVEGDAARVVSIYSTGDRLVLPPASAHVEGARANQRLEHLGHMTLLLSPAVFRLVRDALLERKVAGPAGVLLEGAKG